MKKDGWTPNKAYYILLAHYRGPGRRSAMALLSHTYMLMWHYIIWRVRASDTRVGLRRRVGLGCEPSRVVLVPSRATVANSRIRMKRAAFLEYFGAQNSASAWGVPELHALHRPFKETNAHLSSCRKGMSQENHLNPLDVVNAEVSHLLHTKVVSNS